MTIIPNLIHIVIHNGSDIIHHVDGIQETDENIWDMLLSKQPVIIEKAFDSLESDQQESVLGHLRSMVAEQGWQPEQRVSAQTALDTIADHKD